MFFFGPFSKLGLKLFAYHYIQFLITFSTNTKLTGKGLYWRTVEKHGTPNIRKMKI